MTKRNLLLSAAVASALGAISGSAFAVDLNASTDASSIYVKELVPANTKILGTNLATSVQLGFGIAVNSTRYLRFDLSNAKWGAQITNGQVSTPGATTASTTTVSTAGGTGDAYVIFEIVNTAVQLKTTDAVVFNVESSGVKVTDSSQTVGITYTMHETAANAVANTGALFTKSGNLARFNAALQFTATPKTSTASVVKDFKEFTSSSVSATTTILGTVKNSLSATTYLDASGTAVTALSSLITTASKFVVTGDFSAKGTNGVYLATNTTACSSAVAGSLNTGNTSATIQTSTNTYDAAVCFDVTGSAAITEQTVTVVYDITAASGSAAADSASVTLGTIARDGTTLQTPWFSVAPAYLSRLILTNTGSSAATYKSNCLTETGVTATSGTNATGSIPASGQLVLDASTVCTFSSGTRGAVVFNVVAPSAAIKGAYNITNPTAGSVTVSNMQ